MKTLLAAVAASLTLCSFGHADTHIIYRAGAWSVFGGTVNDGNRVCGMSVENAHSAIDIKYFANTNYLIFMIGKDSWNIPVGTVVPVNFQINGAPSWSAQATANATTMIWFKIGADSIGAFERQFKTGTEMTVWFPQGDERPWTASLIGSDVADHVFSQCTANLIINAPSEPYAPAPAIPTQPYSDSHAPVAIDPQKLM